MSTNRLGKGGYHNAHARYPVTRRHNDTRSYGDDFTYPTHSVDEAHHVRDHLGQPPRANKDNRRRSSRNNNRRSRQNTNVHLGHNEHDEPNNACSTQEATPSSSRDSWRENASHSAEIHHFTVNYDHGIIDLRDDHALKTIIDLVRDVARLEVANKELVEENANLKSERDEAVRRAQQLELYYSTLLNSLGWARSEWEGSDDI